MKSQDELVYFCAKCFASSDNGSWTNGEAVDEALCINCGAGGCAVKIPRWAVKSIREQASWVGKRYYANDEDIQNYEELQALRNLVTKFPGRSAEKQKDCWWVTQKLPGDKSVTVFVEFSEAPTIGHAMAKARARLPYIPEEKLK
jgi:hypothetical protein